jgi:ATP-dependent DNA ligase
MGGGQQVLAVVPSYAPMIPTQVPEPFHRDGWIYEEKVDGWRILAYNDGQRVRLVSRTGVEHSRRFRGVADAVAARRSIPSYSTARSRSSISNSGHASTGCAARLMS